MGRCSTDLHRISIHALREEGDRGRRVQPCGRVDFYPRPPRGGRPQFSTLLSRTLGLFLSTPSARRATGTGQGGMIMAHNFYPRPPRGGRPECEDKRVYLLDFYPRPPRGGRPQTANNLQGAQWNFYPRPPRGGRRVARQNGHQNSAISIHALREEGDVWVMWSSQQQSDFYPRPPRGGRPAGTWERWQITSISIHALREEGDAL